MVYSSVGPNLSHSCENKFLESLQFLFFESNITLFYFSVVFLSVAFCCNCQQPTPRVSTFCYNRVPGVVDILNNGWRDPKTEDRSWCRGIMFKSL